MASSALDAINALTEDQLDTIARTMVGEAMPYDEDGLSGVAWVIKNRASSGTFPSDPAKVAKQPKQFSAWNSSKAGGNNLVRMDASNPRYQQARQIAQQVFSGALPDPTGGATYYHTPAVNPGWDNKMTQTAKFGGHLFYSPSGAKPRPPAGIGMTGAAVGQGAGDLSQYNVPLPRPRPQLGPSFPNLGPEAMNGMGRLVPGRRTNPPTDFATNIGAPMPGQMSSLMGTGPRMSASGSSGGPTPLLAGFSISPSGQLLASGSSNRPQTPASVSMQSTPSVSRGTMSAAGLPTTPNVMNGSVSMSPPRPPGVVPTTSGMAGTVQMAAARPSSIPVPQTDFRMLGNTQQWRPVNPPVLAPPAPPQGALGGMGGLMGGAGAGAGYVPTTPASMPPQPPTTLPNGMPIDSSVPLNSPTRMAYAQQPAQTYRPRVVQPPMVTIASGKTVPVGTTGTAENGRYTFTVQPDGTITKVTNPLTKQQRSDRFTNLDSFGMIK